VEGLPLVAVLRRDDTADFVSFVYGDCVPDDEAGCAPPVEVQVWPACRRSLALHHATPPLGPVPERATIRGVPAAFFEDFTRLEIQTGPVTVVVFADSRARVIRVVRALRAVNGSGPVGVHLPQPSPGALEGELRC